MSQSCGQPVQVSAPPKQGAPWQFNNLKCHLGAITSPLGTVIVIISGQNTFSVLITCYRLCSSLLGTVSSFSNVMLFHIGAIFTPSQYHLLIFPLWSLSSSALSLSSVLGNWQLLDFSLRAFGSDKRSHSFPKSIYCVDFFLFSINFRLWLICSTYTHIIKLPWLQTTIYLAYEISNNSLSTPSRLNNVNKQDNTQFSLFWISLNSGMLHVGVARKVKSLQWNATVY